MPSSTLVICAVLLVTILAAAAAAVIKPARCSAVGDLGHLMERAGSTNHLHLFEISTRPWLFQLSQKYGSNITRLSDIPVQELRAIKAAGIDMIWMMGIWSVGAYGLNYDRTNQQLLDNYAKVLPGFTKDDIIGSPYAVTSYTCNPQLCPNQNSDLVSFKKLLNSLGLKLMLDFVPNHTAVDCPWTSTSPLYFVQAPKGSRPPYDPNRYLPSGIAYGGDGTYVWQDTAQLNYWNPDLVAMRIKELLSVASVADGVRCDMAHLELNDLFGNNWDEQIRTNGWTRPKDEFWGTVISTVKKQFPDFIFLAEVYGSHQYTLQSLGFDYTYDKTLYDGLGWGNLDNLRQWISSGSGFFQAHSARFVSNHDEAEAAAFFGSNQRANAAAVVVFTLPGMRFHWYRDFEGHRSKLDVHLRRAQDEQIDLGTVDFYVKLMNITTQPVFKQGDWFYLNVFGSDTAWTLMAWRWNLSAKTKRLCVINYSSTPGSGRVLVEDAQPVNDKDLIPVTELLTGTVYWRSAAEMRTQGLFCIIPPFSAQLFEY